MQEIEQAAQGVIVGYEAQVEQIRTDSRDHLQQWHSITMRKPSNWSQRRKNAQERLVRLTKDLEETVARNDAKVQEAMTDKRAGLVEAIVEKVVASYGR